MSEKIDTQTKAIEIIAEQVEELDQKKKDLTRDLSQIEVQVNNATSELNFVRSEVAKVTEELSKLKIKHQETLKVNGVELSNLQIEVQKAKDSLDSLLKATIKEKGDLEDKHADLDKKLDKFAEDKKLNQAIIDEKKGYLEAIKKEETELENTRSRAEGEVNAMNALNNKFQGIDSALKNREEGVISQEKDVTNKNNAVVEREAIVASLEISLANREKKVKEDEALVDAKMAIIGEKETYIVKLIEESKLKGVDVSKFEPKEVPEKPKKRGKK